MSRMILASALLCAILAAVPSGSASAQSAPVICIDVGHGGSDVGTSGGGILEKQLNLAVAVRLDALLGSNGYARAMTRSADVGLGNTERARFCNSAGATLLISIHHNGGKNSSTDYSTALYQKRIDRGLATAIVNAVAPVTSGVNSGIKQFASGVLIKSDMPATISEGYFLTNPAEQAKLRDFAAAPVEPWTACAYCDSEARALMEGIATYLG